MNTTQALGKKNSIIYSLTRVMKMAIVLDIWIWIDRIWDRFDKKKKNFGTQMKIGVSLPEEQIKVQSTCKSRRFPWHVLYCSTCSQVIFCREKGFQSQTPITQSPDYMVWINQFHQVLLYFSNFENCLFFFDLALSGKLPSLWALSRKCCIAIQQVAWIN